MVRRASRSASFHLAALGALATACSGATPPVERGAIPLIADDAAAAARLESLRRAFPPAAAQQRSRASGSPAPLLRAAGARGYVAAAGGTRVPRFDEGLAPAALSPVFPSMAGDPMEIEELRGGARVTVTLEGGRDDAPALSAGGYLLHAAAGPGGADLLRRADPDAVEELLHFERPPARAEVRYRITLGGRAAGLRLVENTLEVLDDRGTPRLRVPPPFLIDAAGATVPVTLAVEGCAIDDSPAPPWGRAVVHPGAARCVLRLGWESARPRYPVLLDPAWVATKNMVIPRYDHTLTVLRSGLALAAGGSGMNNAATSSELYDPQTDTWARTGAFATPAARSRHSATLLLDGTVLVAGGTLGGGDMTVYCDLFDPAKGTYKQTWSLVKGRSDHGAVLLPDGRVLVSGGEGQQVNFVSPTLLSAEIWDANKPNGGNQWLAAPAMAEARMGFASAVLPNGRVLVAGGWNQAPAALATAELFDPKANGGVGAWSATGAMTTDRDLPAFSLLGDGRVLVSGGMHANGTLIASAEIYDWQTGKWAATAGLSSARVLHRQVTLGDGTVLAAGGNDAVTTGLSAAELFDPAGNGGAGTFQVTTPLLKGRAHTAADRLLDGRMIVSGGYFVANKVLTYCQEAEIFGGGLIVPPDMAVPADLAVIPDFSVVPDLVPLRDLAPPIDLAPAIDRTPPPDLGPIADFAPPADLAAPVDLLPAPDLAPPADLSPRLDGAPHDDGVPADAFTSAGPELSPLDPNLREDPGCTCALGSRGRASTTPAAPGLLLLAAAWVLRRRFRRG